MPPFHPKMTGVDPRLPERLRNLKLGFALVFVLQAAGCGPQLVRQYGNLIALDEVERHGLSAWQATSGLESFSTDGAHDSAAFAWAGFMYLSGGQNRMRDRIHRARILENGMLGSWVDMATLSPSARLPSNNQDHAVLVYQPKDSVNAVLYLIGGWNGGALDAVYSAPLLSDGTVGGWVQGPSLQSRRHGHAAVISGDRLYVVGGWSAGAVDVVESVRIDSYGSFVGSWTRMNSLPQPLAFPSGVSDPNGAFGTLVFGGENPNACPRTAQSTVYRFTENPQSGWRLVGTLPEPLFDMGILLTSSFVILTGGAHRSYPSGSTSCPWVDALIRKSVYFASIQENGAIGPWVTAPDLPAPRADHSLVLYRDYVYVLGGRGVNLDPPYPTEVWFARFGHRQIR